MDRRTFLGSVAGSLFAVAAVARADKLAMPVIGFLSSGSAAQWNSYVAAFREGLNEVGYTEGKNVAIEFRWAEGQYDRLPALAADLVRREVAVIVSSGGTVSAQAAKAATSTIPIVSTMGSDPVKFGLVASFGHPGGNLTGISIFGYEMAAKRMELLHELVPKATEIAVISNPNNQPNPHNPQNPNNPQPGEGFGEGFVQDAARALGEHLHVHFLRAGTAEEIDAAFVAMARLGAEALIVNNDPLFNARREQFVALAARNAIPAIFQMREFVVAGGLLSYGVSISDAHRQIGIYAGKILDGAKPADLPVLHPTKFELVINRKTAKALGITVPGSLLQRADELIQ